MTNKPTKFKFRVPRVFEEETGFDAIESYYYDSDVNLIYLKYRSTSPGVSLLDTLMLFTLEESAANTYKIIPRGGVKHWYIAGILDILCQQYNLPWPTFGRGGKHPTYSYFVTFRNSDHIAVFTMLGVKFKFHDR